MAFALIVSLLAHAGLLFGVAGRFPARAGVPALALSVVALNRTVFGDTTPPPAVQTAAEEAPRADEPARVEAPPPSRPPKASVKRIAIPKPKPKEAEVRAAVSDPIPVPATDPDPASAAVSESAAWVPARADPGLSSSGGTRAGAPAVFGETAPARWAGASADDVGRYRSALKNSARRLKRYPPLAREREWEGTVEIALNFSGAGAEPALTVAASSGRKILDEQALETLRQAARRTPLPDALKGRDFRIVQAVTFSLEDGE
ncbi:MAG: TonB family protein [Candidatus Accumulibacter sp.]|nr:TonB family protein [Accumulibacter sp.]